MKELEYPFDGAWILKNRRKIKKALLAEDTSRMEKRIAVLGGSTTNDIVAMMELFLWDLELFLQIQKRLGEHIVLKGGAATQFYLPIEAQRTSVDILMILRRYI